MNHVFVFSVVVLQQADSEGALCPSESLDSAGSNSTLASSVIEVEAERVELGLTPQLRPRQEEEVLYTYLTQTTLQMYFTYVYFRPVDVRC